MQNENNTKLTFLGGTGSVTGANYLLEAQNTDGKKFKVLVDCGFEQVRLFLRGLLAS